MAKLSDYKHNIISNDRTVLFNIVDIQMGPRPLRLRGYAKPITDTLWFISRMSKILKATRGAARYLAPPGLYRIDIMSDKWRAIDTDVDKLSDIAEDNCICIKRIASSKRSYLLTDYINED